MAAPRKPMRRLHDVFNYLYFIYILYSMGIQPSVYRKGIQPINSSALINPTCFFNVFRVGLKSHIVLLIAGHVA